MTNFKINKAVSILVSLAMIVLLLPNSAIIANAAYENTHINTGNLRVDIVAVAKTQIGYHEGSLEGTTNGSNNYTKYNADLYKINGSYNYAWCQSFVSWCAKQAGISSTLIPRTAGTVTAKDYFINNGVYHTGPYEGGNYIPSPGDIIYFYSKSTDSKHHVGIVADCDGSTVYTIEGNSSNEVKMHEYSVSYSNIRGYGVPFDSPIPPTPNEDSDLGIPYTRPSGNPLIKKGQKGDSVRWVQYALHEKLGYDIGSAGVDGDFGNGTYNAVKQFQSDYDLDADGIVGPATIAKIVEVVSEKLKGDDIPTGSELGTGAGQTLPDGDYAIFSAINPDYYVDIVGTENPAPEGTNVGMYTIETGTLPSSVDCWTVEYLNNGFYKIQQKGTNMCLDVNGADLHRGTNVQVWTDNGSVAQQWSILRTDNGYKLQSRCSSYFLDVNGGVFEQLTNVQVWESNESAAQLFCFVPYGGDSEQTIPDGEYSICLAKDNNYCLDAQGYSKDEYKLETNIQLWTTADCNDTFYIKYVGNGYYTIAEAQTGYVLDIYNLDSSEYLKAARNIQLHNYNASSRNQKWMIKPNADGSYKIISQFSGYCIDLNGGVTEIRQNIEQYPDNGTDAQKWNLIPAVSTPQKCELIMKKTEAFVGERVAFIGSSDTADKFTLHVLKDGEDYLTDETPNDQIDILFEEAGNYTAYMTAINRKGELDSKYVTFKIKDTLRIKSDAKYELPFGTGYTYKSSNEGIAVVSKSGVITAISDGTATITVIDADKNTYKIKTTVSDQSILGDCDDNGEFNVADVVLLQKWLLAVPDTHLENWQAADLCEDDRLDVFDLCLMKRKLIYG